MPSAEPVRIAQLVHLSGPQRGRTEQIRGATYLAQDAAGELRVCADCEGPDLNALAVLVPGEDHWRIEAAASARVWVNRSRLEAPRTLHGTDLIEAGEGGPVLRFRPRRSGDAGYKTVREAFGDCVDCARMGGGGTLDRLAWLTFRPFYELTTQVAPAARAGFIALVVVLAVSVGLLWARNVRLERQLDRQLEQIEDISALLETSEGAAFDVSDFEEVRSQLDFRIDDTLARLEALENRATARGRVIEASADAVIFLQGAYGFADVATGRPLRMAGPAVSGVPPVTTDGRGDVLELRYTGTGFLIGDAGMVVTNRHVANPWEYDENAQRLIARGFAPQMRRLIGYLPGVAEAFDVRVLDVHDEADVALLECSDPTTLVIGLELETEAPDLGAEVVVLGYPTGMRALLARADPEFVQEALGAGPVGFWELAAALAAGGYIEPLATVGSVGQATAGTIVYDAETTHGGSGGPVLDLDGRVVAVNAAVIPEFGGSNLGVPASLVRDLVDDNAGPATAQAQGADDGPGTR